MRANSDWQVSDFEVQGADITGAYIYILVLLWTNMYLYSVVLTYILFTG